jgi:muconolactone delta-isomerase
VRRDFGDAQVGRREHVRCELHPPTRKVGHRRKSDERGEAFSESRPRKAARGRKFGDEAAHAWKLWKEGILRENYARMDVTGVVIVFEAGDAGAVRALLAEFPMTKAGFIEWDVIPLGAPLPLEALMRDDVVASTHT